MREKQPITLFVQCLVDGLYPDVAEAVVAVFDKLGIQVECPPDQTCCGQPAFNAGHHKAARRAARHFIRVFEDAPVIVCPSGSCVEMVRHHYPSLFSGEPDWERRARKVGEKTYEFTEYLVDVLKVRDLGSGFRGRITYHESCHLSRFLGIRNQPRELIGEVAGAEFVEMDKADRCCGFGGTFSVKFAEISEAVLKEKVDAILATGADAVVGCDISCLMNIQGMLSRRGLPVKTLHIAQLLAA